MFLPSGKTRMLCSTITQVNKPIFRGIHFGSAQKADHIIGKQDQYHIRHTFTGYFRIA